MICVVLSRSAVTLGGDMQRNGRLFQLLDDMMGTSFLQMHSAHGANPGEGAIHEEISVGCISPWL